MLASAALATLDQIDEDGLVARAADVGEYLARRLAETVGDHPAVANVRAVGLLAGVEL